MLYRRRFFYIMTISLSKGQKINLSKEFGGLDQVHIGLGWDTQKYDGAQDFDLDTSAFLLDANGRANTAQDFVFYGNATGGNGSVNHSGDNRTGEGASDDEVIDVILSRVPQSTERIAFTVTIHEAELRNQNFGQVSNAYIRIMDKNSGEELIRYDLEEDFSVETALVVAELYRKDGQWRFGAVGAGYSGGLNALATSFGLDVD